MTFSIVRRYIVICLLSCTVSVYGQVRSVIDSHTKASLVKQKYTHHSPTTAAIFSAVLPGAGQIYNKKYWKAPIVWGGLAFLTSQWIKENDRFQEAKDAYVFLLDSANPRIPYNGTTDIRIIQSTKNVYRNQRDMYLIFGVLFYTLNIVDAAVDGHFFKFDVSDDLSMKIDLDMKNYMATPQVPSLSFSLYSDKKKKSKYYYINTSY